MFECELVRELVGCAAEDRRVEGRVQRAATAQFAGVSNPGGLCAATRSVSRLRASRYAARHSPTGSGLTACEFRMISPADSGSRPRLPTNSPPKNATANPASTTLEPASTPPP